MYFMEVRMKKVVGIFYQFSTIRAIEIIVDRYGKVLLPAILL